MAEDQKPELNQNEQPRSRLLPLAAAGFLVIVAIGGAAWFFSRRSSARASQPGQTHLHEGGVKAVLHLESLTVNLADGEQNAFLRVGIDLGLGQDLPDSKGTEKASPLTPRVRDTLLMVLSTWPSNALLAQDGKTKLKQELLRALQERVPELGVTEVYFTDFLVQR